MAADNETKKYAITVIYNGVDQPLEINPHESVTAVLQAAIHLFPVTEQHHLLALFDDQGREITAEDQSAEAAGLVAGSRVILRQSAVKGG
jgi:hypothetical protein